MKKFEVLKSRIKRPTLLNKFVFYNKFIGDIITLCIIRHNFQRETLKLVQQCINSVIKFRHCLLDERVSDVFIVGTEVLIKKQRLVFDALE